MIKLAFNKAKPNLVFAIDEVLRVPLVGGIVEYYLGTLKDTSTVPDTEYPDYKVQVMGFESDWSEVPTDVGGTSQINNQPNKDVTPTTSKQIIKADKGYTGLTKVTVNAAPITEPKTVHPSTGPNTIVPDEGDLGIARVDVQPMNLAEIEVTATSETQLIKTPDGYDAIKSVSIAAVDNPQTITEFCSLINSIIVKFGRRLLDIQSNYIASTEEAVVLHTPDVTHTKYIIFKNNSDRYSIMWKDTTSNAIGYYRGNADYMQFGKLTVLNNPATIVLSGNTITNGSGNPLYFASGYTYTYYLSSTDYDTAEDAIQAMINNTATYGSKQTKYSSNANYTFKRDTNYNFPYTNCDYRFNVVMGGGTGTGTYWGYTTEQIRKISTNETYVAV